MKRLESIVAFTQERNADLMRAFRQQLALAHHIILPDIFERVAHSPSSRFWVSEERAAIVICAMLKGKPFPRMGNNKRQMFEEIYRRFLIERGENPETSVYELVAGIVNQPAPKFYLTPRTVGEIIRRIKIGWYDKPCKPSVVTSSLGNTEVQQVSHDNDKKV